MRRVLRLAGALAATVGLLGAGTAAARPVAGATYTGTYGDAAGAISFTVSADGSQLVRYRIADVVGDTCRFHAQGDPGERETPVTDDAFEYRLYDAILFRGRFAAGGAASGSFRLVNHAVGDRPACDTGVVAWRASTTTPADGESGPPAPGAGGAGASNGAAGAGGASTSSSTQTTSTTTRRVAHRTRLGKLRRSGRTITGRLSSSLTSCRGGRRVHLRRGALTLRTTTSKPDGRFVLTVPANARGARLRLRVDARAGRSACAVVTSASLPA